MLSISLFVNHLKRSCWLINHDTFYFGRGRGVLKLMLDSAIVIRAKKKSESLSQLLAVGCFLNQLSLGNFSHHHVFSHLFLTFLWPFWCLRLESNHYYYWCTNWSLLWVASSFSEDSKPLFQVQNKYSIFGLGHSTAYLLSFLLIFLILLLQMIGMLRIMFIITVLLVQIL